jgi:hypothetical protein
MIRQNILKAVDGREGNLWCEQRRGEGHQGVYVKFTAH